ncbi:MAG: hypothetical protein C4520_17065 [Candidatus Abyssobacteria bacterium SURF_5]|uniref:Glycosyltransferase RgtA/B/C/D-like domain-containing protein n=1 Tax=Abyssobacteria bacterium (strain SURF_5) TaxID=2093360 RepID=A0A3A4N640_ABYX5|nr:MAG: hypothetical protein C4520_17065 [Candidatus Abyssubacteria bacterium SURF_5]
MQISIPHKNSPLEHVTRAAGWSTKRAATVAFVSVIVYLLLIAYQVAPYGYNLTSLIRVGSTNPFYDPAILGDGVVVFNDPKSGGDGYDGQFYLYMIKGLLMGEDGISNPFRYQRILYPVVVYLFALGQPGLIPISMPLVNLLAISISSLLLWKLVRDFGLRPKYLFLYTLNIGFLVAVFYDVATPLCISLVVASIYFLVRERLWLASAMMALSLLTQENGAIVLAVVTGWLLAQRNLRGAIVFSCSVVPWTVWQLFLWLREGKLPFIMSGNHFRPPFAGMISYISAFEWAGDWQHMLRDASVFPMMLFVTVLLVVSVFEMKRNPQVFTLLLVVHALVGVCFNKEQIWSSTISSPARALAGVFPFLVICYAQNPSRRLLLLIVLSVLLSLMGIARILLMPSHPYFVT